METCSECGGLLKVLACIEDPVVIENILTPLQDQAISGPTNLLPESRAPPAGLFSCHHQSPSIHPNGGYPNRSARVSVGLMPGVAPKVVLATEKGWMVSANWGKISGWWPSTEPFITPRRCVAWWEKGRLFCLV